MLALVLAVLIVGINACGGSNQAQVIKVDSLQHRVDSMEKIVSALREKSELADILEGWDKVAYLTPGSDGYAIVKSDLGAITVSIQNIEPYANGARVTLRLGNTTSARINGAKAKIEWGKVDGHGMPENDSAKSREVTFSESLGPGRWTNVRLVLDGVPPTELGFVRVRDITHTGIELFK